MSEVSNSVQASTGQYGTTSERKKLTRKLFAAYINEQLISSPPVNNGRKPGSAIHTFDSSDLFYLLSLAEKLPVYGAGFSSDEVH